MIYFHHSWYLETLMVPSYVHFSDLRSRLLKSRLFTCERALFEEFEFQCFNFLVTNWDPEGFQQVREAVRIHFHQVWSDSDWFVPKNKKQTYKK